VIPASTLGGAHCGKWAAQPTNHHNQPPTASGREGLDGKGASNLVQGGLLHNRQELLFIDLPILVLVKLINHGLQLVVREFLPELPRHTAQVLQRDSPLLIVIEKLEGLQNLIHRVSLGDALGHDVQKVFVPDVATAVAVVLSHQLQHLGLLDIKSQSPHRDLELMIVNLACSVTVEQIESLLDLLPLLLRDLHLLSSLGAAKSCVPEATSGEKWCVKLENFAVQGVEEPEEASTEIYLMLHFGGFKLFRTDAADREADPTWQFKAGFQFKAEPALLEQRCFKIRCFKRRTDNHAIAEGLQPEVLGEAFVDLWTVAVGPSTFRLSLVSEAGELAGTVTFGCMMRQVADPLTTRFGDVRLTMMGSPAPAWMQITSTLQPEAVLELPHSQGGEWESTDGLHFPASLEAMLTSRNEGFRVKVFDAAGSVQGECALPFRDLVLAGEVTNTGRIDIPFKCNVLWPEHGQSKGKLGELSGVIKYENLPVHAQMIGGRTVGDGTIEGEPRLLAPGLPYPSTMIRAPQVHLTAKEAAGCTLAADAAAGESYDSENVAADANGGDIGTTPVPLRSALDKVWADMCDRTRHLKMPQHWSRRVGPEGQQYFADRRSRLTTWTDPRLLGKFWDQRVDRATGRAYFAHLKQEQTTSVDPRGCPPNWEMKLSSSGEVYYAFHPTRTTTYVDPRGLPQGVSAAMTAEGRLYFRDRNTRSTSWEDPREGQAEDTLQKWRCDELRSWLEDQVVYAQGTERGAKRQQEDGVSTAPQRRR